MPYLPGAVAGDPNGLSTQSQLVVDSSNTHVIVFLEDRTDYIMEVATLSGSVHSPIHFSSVITSGHKVIQHIQIPLKYLHKI